MSRELCPAVQYGQGLKMRIPIRERISHFGRVLEAIVDANAAAKMPAAIGTTDGIPAALSTSVTLARSQTKASPTVSTALLRRIEDGPGTYGPPLHPVTTVRRPLVHELLAFVKKIRPQIGGNDFAGRRVRKRGFGHLMLSMRFFGRPNLKA